MAKCILGIDQGTTGTRACVVDHSSRLVSNCYREHEQHLPGPGLVEHDPNEIWLNVCDVALEAVAKAGDGVEIAGIGIANQGETVMIWDRRSGEPLHNAIVWQDTRTQPFFDQLDDDVAKDIVRATGLKPDSYFSASKIRWLLDNVPQARVLADSGDLMAGTLDAWLIWKLTGGKQHVTDVSTAARTLLFNLHTREYDPDLLALFDVPSSILPRIEATVAEFGTVCGVGDRLDGVKILASIVDQPAALFVQAPAAGSAKITYGTGVFAYMNTGVEVPASDHGLLTTACWEVDGDTTYALDGGVFAAGSVVSWLKDEAKLISEPSEIDRIVGEAKGSDALVCVPSLVGMAAPIWDRRAKAAWLGMGPDTNRAALVRAAMDGIAARVAQVVSAMEADSGIQLQQVGVDGGLTNCAYLMQRQADLLGIDVVVSEVEEATVLGAASLAAKGAGLKITGASQSGAVRYAPRLQKDERKRLMERFDRAVSIVREWS